MYVDQKVGYDRATTEQGRAICEFLLGQNVLVSIPLEKARALFAVSVLLANGTLCC